MCLVVCPRYLSLTLLKIPHTQMHRINILGVRVNDVDAKALERSIIDCVEQKKKATFAYANVHAINIAQRNQRFREFLNNSDILYCDGEGLRLAARVLGATPPRRTALTHWIWDLARTLEERRYSVYLLGGRNEVVAGAVRRLCGRYPCLKLAGYHHGYFDKSEKESAAVIMTINSVKPNVLFVGFGMPEQEMWVERNLTQLEVNAVILCGGMFDYLAGESTVAPRWMSVNGMEWLHRLLHDPARLWKRYLLGNPVFLFRILLQRLAEGRQI